MKANVAIALYLSDAVSAKCAARTRSDPASRWFNTWCWGLTSPQPNLWPSAAPYTILIDTFGRKITTLSLSLIDVLLCGIKLEIDCWVWLHFYQFQVCPITIRKEYARRCFQTKVQERLEDTGWSALFLVVHLQWQTEEESLPYKSVRLICIITFFKLTCFLRLIKTC